MSNKRILSLNGKPVQINNSYITIETEGLQDKTIIPKAYPQIIFADSAYEGLNSVIIEGDDNLIPENLPEDIIIFGVQGTRHLLTINDLPSVTAIGIDENGEKHTWTLYGT